MKNLDLLVHANALLPCLVVWFCLSVLKSAWAAVLLFEGLCLVDLLTLRLRDDALARRTAARVRALAATLARRAWRRRGQVATGALCSRASAVCGVLVRAARAARGHRARSERQPRRGARLGDAARAGRAVRARGVVLHREPRARGAVLARLLYFELGSQLRRYPSSAAHGGAGGRAARGSAGGAAAAGCEAADDAAGGAAAAVPAAVLPEEERAAAAAPPAPRGAGGGGGGALAAAGGGSVTARPASPSGLGALSVGAAAGGGGGGAAAGGGGGGARAAATTGRPARRELGRRPRRRRVRRRARRPAAIGRAGRASRARERVLWQLPAACLPVFRVAPSAALRILDSTPLSQVVVDVFVGRELALLAFGGLALASRAWIWLAEHKVRAIQTPSSRANVERSLTRRARHSRSDSRSSSRSTRAPTSASCSSSRRWTSSGRGAARPRPRSPSRSRWRRRRPRSGRRGAASASRRCRSAWTTERAPRIAPAVRPWRSVVVPRRPRPLLLQPRAPPLSAGSEQPETARRPWGDRRIPARRVDVRGAAVLLVLGGAHTSRCTRGRRAARRPRRRARRRRLDVAREHVQAEAAVVRNDRVLVVPRAVRRRAERAHAVRRVARHAVGRSTSWRAAGSAWDGPVMYVEPPPPRRATPELLTVNVGAAARASAA